MQNWTLDWQKLMNFHLLKIISSLRWPLIIPTTYAHEMIRRHYWFRRILIFSTSPTSKMSIFVSQKLTFYQEGWRILSQKILISNYFEICDYCRIWFHLGALKFNILWIILWNIIWMMFWMILSKYCSSFTFSLYIIS